MNMQPREGEKFFFFYPKPKTSQELKEISSRDKKKLKGRTTIAAIYNTQDNSLSFGVAICSKKDIFEKSIGRVKAIGRARNNSPILCKHLDKGVKVITIFLDSAKMIDRVTTKESLLNNKLQNKASKKEFAL